MDGNCPHTMMKQMRRIAVYIAKENKWYPARDYQATTVKDFIEVVYKNLSSYKSLLDQGILISSELKKEYAPLIGVNFNISYDTTNTDPVYFINTIQLDASEDDMFESHMATIYHTYDNPESLKSHPVIGKIGYLSNELVSDLKN